MKAIYKLTLLSFVVLLFAQCGGKENGGGVTPEPQPEPKPEPVEKPWNKDRTMEVLYITSLKNSPLSSDDEGYKMVMNEVQKVNPSSYSWIIIDRSDALKHEGVWNNPVMNSFFSYQLFPYFALDRATDSAIEGKMILMKQYVDKMEHMRLTDECYLFRLKTKVKGTSSKGLELTLPLTTLHITSKQAIAALNGELPNITSSRDPHVIVGSVSSSLFKELATSLQKVGGYQVEKIKTPNKGDNVLFFFAPTSWKYRATETVFTKTINGNSVNGLKIALETGINNN